MKMSEIINTLKNSGKKVEYKKRTDGSYRITKIDGKHFKASKGNSYARDLLNVSLSKKQSKQLKVNRKTIKKSLLTSHESKKLKEYNKKVVKLKQPKLTKITFRKRKKKYGSKKASSALKNNLIHYSKRAYRGNIEYLIDLLENKDILPKTRNYLKRYIKNINDESLVEAYNLIYKMQNSQVSENYADSKIVNIFEEGRKQLINV